MGEESRGPLTPRPTVRLTSPGTTVTVEPDADIRTGNTGAHRPERCAGRLYGAAWRIGGF